MPTDATFLLAALLIIAAASGFAFKVYSDRDRDLPPRISADYIRGLNLVLNRRTDEALELFVQMAKVDDETLETHFALGHLFRRRGEVERAIRIHENLLARPTLNDAQRHQALLSLAEDYLGAGLFDRAEQLFSELVDSPTVAETALEKLVYIYEREREWNKAIEARRKLEILTGEKSSQVAHYYCELAEAAIAAGDVELARGHLKSSIRSETGALRGTLIRAAIAKTEGDYADALRLYEQVLTTHRWFMAEVLPVLMDCYRQLGQLAQFDEFLERWIARDATVQRDIAYATVLTDLSGSAVLERCVESFVLQHAILAKLVNADALAMVSPERRHEAIVRIADALRQIASSSARYRCSNCGYSTQRFIWYCPSCKEWETVRPMQDLHLESVLT